MSLPRPRRRGQPDKTRYRTASIGNEIAGMWAPQCRNTQDFVQAKTGVACFDDEPKQARRETKLRCSNQRTARQVRALFKSASETVLLLPALPDWCKHCQRKMQGVHGQELHMKLKQGSDCWHGVALCSMKDTRNRSSTYTFSPNPSNSCRTMLCTSPMV